MKKLFTERHGAAKPRIHNQLDAATAKGLLSLVRARIDEEWFGLSFPTKCADGYAYAGTNLNKLQEMMTSYGLPAPQDTFDNPSSDGEIFDLLEFAYEVIAEAKNPWLHSGLCCKVDWLREDGLNSSGAGHVRGSSGVILKVRSSFGRCVGTAAMGLAIVTSSR